MWFLRTKMHKRKCCLAREAYLDLVIKNIYTYVRYRRPSAEDMNTNALKKKTFLFYFQSFIFFFFFFSDRKLTERCSQTFTPFYFTTRSTNVLFPRLKPFV